MSSTLEPDSYEFHIIVAAPPELVMEWYVQVYGGEGGLEGNFSTDECQTGMGEHDLR